MINQGNTATFIDNIIVAIDTKKRYDKLVEEVLKRLEENNLFVKPEKCQWKVKKVELLSVAIGPQGVEMQKKKVNRVLSQPVPRNIKEIKKFLGLANYYRWFIKDFARIVVPLHLLVRKKKKQRQREEQEEAFRRLKKVFITKLVLAIPDLDRKIRIEADASDYIIEGVLLVKYGDEKQRPVAFISKSLNTTEQNYEIHDKEILVVIQYLESWRYYLEGTKVRFEIQIDHKNLQYFMTSQKLN